MTLRPIQANDYDRVIAVLDYWWGGRTAGEISYFPDYDRPGEDRVVFVKNIC